MGDINKLEAIAIQAGKIILSHYNTNCRLENKEDKSPVTLADLEADKFIVSELNRQFPDIPVVSEEGSKTLPKGDKFFLVDPLDGTKSFIRGDGQFTVNIGLIEAHRAKMGVIYIPVSGDIYSGDGTKAWKNGAEIRCRKLPEDKVVVVASHSHLDSHTKEYIDNLRVKYPSLEFTSASSSLKFCRLAEGVADIYPRFGRTMEWDTAAGQAILQSAGGKVYTPEGEEFLYFKNAIWENGNFVAKGLE